MKARSNQNLVGMIFGKMVVKSFSHKDKFGKKVWSCLCGCGNASLVAQSNLFSGNTTSCGCLSSKHFIGQKSSKYAGFTVKTHPLYETWAGMRKRCLNKKCHNYHLYGGRGISICKRWDSFQNFLDDMGERPDGHTLDRIDNNGNYEPSNCRWASKQNQALNRTNHPLWRRVLVNGVEYPSISNAAKHLGLGVGKLKADITRKHCKGDKYEHTRFL